MDDPTDLNDTQRARADALVIADRLLPRATDMTDLVDLAVFILDGTHPHDRYQDRSVPLTVLSTPGDDPGDDDLLASGAVHWQEANGAYLHAIHGTRPPRLTTSRAEVTCPACKRRLTQRDPWEAPKGDGRPEAETND